ncbi:MAG TPA: zinc dependent phospholipase C family protein, partial [Gemmatimonadaceae bacterium]|nr:zinc dependent phospholipase C family protein [Gemmatimonadaceae bacterium]
MGSETTSRRLPSRLLLRCALIALATLIVAPGVAHAWTPGTHVFLGEAVIRSLAALPPAIGALLSEFPFDFLYGSIAADTSIAKKYAPVGRHCHSWNVGFEILHRAGDERLRAFGLGYLAHLAADSVAHNYFVPHQLAVTSSTSALGHSYWESRFETHLGSEYARRARDLILIDHSPSDQLLDRVLSPTIFSTPTN